MHRPSNFLFVQLGLHSLHLSQRGGRTAGHLADAKNSKGPNLKPGWIGILQVGCRPNLPTEGILNERLEGGLPADSKGLGLHEKVIRKNQGRFHNMADRMVVRLPVKLWAPLRLNRG